VLSRFPSLKLGMAVCCVLKWVGITPEMFAFTESSPFFRYQAKCEI
jgi:hypothetical protein